jgi:hypothetical protein
MPYPFSFDAFTTKVFGEVCEASHINAVQAGIVALQTKLGLDTSGDAYSIDYLLKSPAALNPGHTHSETSITSVAEAAITRPATPILARLNQNELVTGQWTFPTLKSTGKITTTGGYGSGSASIGEIRIGAGGTAPDLASISFGNSASNKLHVGYESGGGFAPVFTFVASGKFGIAGMTDPHGNLQFPADATVRKIVLYENVNNDHQFYGFGVSGGLRLQIAATTGGMSAWAGVNSTSSVERLRLLGSGKLRVSNLDGFNLDTIPSGGSTEGVIAAYTKEGGFLGSGAGRSISIEQYFDSGNNHGPMISVRRSRGVLGALSSILSGDILGGMEILGQASTGTDPVWWEWGGLIRALAQTNWTHTANVHPTRLDFSSREYGTPAQMASVGLAAGGGTILGSEYIGQTGAFLPRMTLLPEGHLILGPWTGVPQAPIRDQLKAGSRGYIGQVCLSISGYGNAGGNPNGASGVLELTNTAPDADGRLLGVIHWTNPYITSGPAGADTIIDKQAATILSRSSGPTANARGGYLQFNTKPDSLALRQVLLIDRDGNFLISNTNAVPATPAAGTGMLYVESGALKYKGASGTVTPVGAA